MTLRSPLRCCQVLWEGYRQPIGVFAFSVYVGGADQGNTRIHAHVRSLGGQVGCMRHLVELFRMHA